MASKKDMTKGFLWFWLVPYPDSEPHRPGFNLTFVPNPHGAGGGFKIILFTGNWKFRFRFRRGFGFSKAFIWNVYRWEG